MTHFPDLINEAVKPDIIADSPAGTFIGWLDRKAWKRSEAPEGQRIWKIRKIETTEAEGNTTTRILYPEGSADFAFVWNDRESVTYQFKN